MLEGLRAALAARGRSSSARIERIEAALNSYRRALELQVTHEFAAEHQLKAPAKVGISAARAAEELREAVLALPELMVAPAPAPASTSLPPSTIRSDPPSAPETLPGWPKLRAALSTQRLVVIGALSRDRSDSAPEGFGEHIEWIDTERDGVHALGNLPQRIRHGRVAAVISLDRAVKHKHSEPALAAARDAHVPVAFAGQGGRASLERAITQLEGMLGTR
jgi:hypothetical protein